jgi:multiple sugar transport system substrate-binding protein
MLTRRLARREFLVASGLATAATLLAACQPKVVEKIVKETVEVQVEKVVAQTVVVEKEKEVTKVVEKEKVVEKAVTNTPAPRAAVTIVTQHGGPDWPDTLAKTFEEKYAPYKVQTISGDTNTLMAMLAAGQQLDVYITNGVDCAYDVLRRLPLNLDPYFAVSQVFKEDDILSVNDYYKVHGSRYGIAKDWSPDYPVYIRKDYFDEAGVTVPLDKPITYQDWRALSAKLTKKEGGRMVRWGTGWAPLICPILHPATTFDPPASLWSADFAKMSLRDNPQLMEVAKFFIDWEKEGTLPSALNPFVGGWAAADFQDGRSASMFYGYWASGCCLGAAEWDLDQNLYMLPAPLWGKTYNNPCVSATGGAISVACKIPEAAWTYFEFFFGEDGPDFRAKTGFGLPALKSKLPLLPQNTPWRKRVYDQVQWDLKNSLWQSITPMPYVSIITLLQPVWAKYDESVLRGQMTFDQMIDAVEKDVNQAILEGMQRAGLIKK